MGITVYLLKKTEVGIDAFNRPVYDTQRIAVNNVLVAPYQASEPGEEYELTNRKVIYQLAIPKTDTNTWESQKVEFWGRVWEVVGIPTQGISDMIPGPWNKKVKVAVYE